MFKPSAIRSRLGLASVAVVALLVLSTGSVLADTIPGDGTFSQSGKRAEFYSGDCQPNGDGTVTCTSTGISAFVGKMSDSLTRTTHSSQVCVYLDVYTYVEETGEPVGEPLFEAGCLVDLPNGALTFGSKLSTATLLATTITVVEMVCNEETCEPGASRDVTVAGTWSAFGPTYSSKYRSTGDDGTCRYAESGRGSSREATFSGTLDGAAVGENGYAYLSEGKSTFRSRCIEI